MKPIHRTLHLLLATLLFASLFGLILFLYPSVPIQATADLTPTAVYRLVGWNDLGMHCMNESFATLAVLPPFNTLWAQLIRQGAEPELVTATVTIEYSINDNTYSAGKTDFWTYAPQLFPGNPNVTQPNVGLMGAHLSGNMTAQNNAFVIVGVPLTPYRDSAPQPVPANWYPYQLAHLVAKDSGTGQMLAETTTVAPVSTEMNCVTCHSQDGDASTRYPISPTASVELNILKIHDYLSQANYPAGLTGPLVGRQPVLCAECHSSNALGAAGVAGISSLSRGMHNHHATLDDITPNTQGCYFCHPGQVTRCLRDVMFRNGKGCVDCHGTMSQVADPNRRPWIDLPRCETCHGAKFAENPGARYRDSKGHGGLYCEACHGSPHAIVPTLQTNDNLQNTSLQGYARTLDDCRVCHGVQPTSPGPHDFRQGYNRTIYFPALAR